MPSISSNVDPFSRPVNHEVQAVWTYKVMTLFTWLFNVLVSIYYTFGMPQETRDNGGKMVWSINESIHTLFSLDRAITSLYWSLLFLLQIAYIWHLFSPHKEDVHAAVGVGSHFIFNNTAQLGFIYFFVQEYFVWAEIVLLINLVNLLVLYFRHNTYPRVIHVPVTSGPLAWTFIALYWNGAIALQPYMDDNFTKLAFILGITSTWGILIFGWAFLFLRNDYTLTLALSILVASLGTEQYLIHNTVWQWSSAFAIMALLYIPTLFVGVPAAFGKELTFRRKSSALLQDLQESTERAPLLTVPDLERAASC